MFGLLAAFLAGLVLTGGEGGGVSLSRDHSGPLPSRPKPLLPTAKAQAQAAALLKHMTPTNPAAAAALKRIAAGKPAKAQPLTTLHFGTTDVKPGTVPHYVKPKATVTRAKPKPAAPKPMQPTAAPYRMPTAATPAASMQPMTPAAPAPAAPAVVVMSSQQSAAQQLYDYLTKVSRYHSTWGSIADPNLTIQALQAQMGPPPGWTGKKWADGDYGGLTQHRGEQLLGVNFPTRN